MSEKSSPSPAEKRLCVGEIGAPHGVRGAVKLKSFTESPAALFAYAPLFDGDGREVRLKRAHAGGGTLIAAVAGVTSRAAAEKLKGAKLYCSRAALPPPGKNRYYAGDLKGLAAIDEKGRDAGRVTGLYNFGAGDILAVENDEGREWLLPFRQPFAGKPDLKTGRIGVEIPPDFPFSEKKKPGAKKPRRKKVLRGV